MTGDAVNIREAFIGEATWHGSLERANAILAEHPGLASADIHVAAILGDDAAVDRFIGLDRANATARSGPYGADALNYLGLSKYLRLDESRTPAFVRAATALLDAGADPNTGFWLNNEFETAMYGASGLAHNPDLTRLLLERGADPNDIEVVYHTPESNDNRSLTLLVETGKLTAESLGIMLIRKIDWHDWDGVSYLLAHGAPAAGARDHGWRALHHALARCNDLRVIALLLDHGADPHDASQGINAIARAAREGRDDVLDEFAKRGIAVALIGVDGLIAACAHGDAAQVGAIVSADPTPARDVIAMGGALLARFTGNGNLEGVRQLLDLGVSPVAPFEEGDGYFGIPKGSLPIHVAAWRAQHEIVKLLIARGSPVSAADANGATPLVLAVRACVDSYWTGQRAPDSVAALLAAEAATDGVKYPCGYAEVDALLEKAGARL